MENQKPTSFSSELEVIKNALFVSNGKTEAARKKVPYHVVLLLSITLGWSGLDRFYLGKIGTGILKTITLGGLGIWWMIDVFLILFNKQTDVLGQEFEGADDKDATVLAYLTLGGLFHYFYLGMNKLGCIRAGLLILFFFTIFLDFPTIGVLLYLIHVIWTLFDLYLVLSGRLSQDINGVPVKRSSEKYQSIALLFSVFAGVWGLDRFYLGHRLQGLLKLFTFGGLLLWYLLDIVLIILNTLKDVDGNSLIQE